jgi:hypothetical protein
MVGARLQVSLLSYLTPLLPSLSLFDSLFNLPCTVAKGGKTIRFRGCQGHKISLALPNSSSYPAFLSGKKSSCCVNYKDYMEGFELYINYKNSSSGICTFLLDVSDASSSGTDIWSFALVL